MRTLLANTASALATAALMVLCDARPGLPPSANAASSEAPGAMTASERRGDSDLDAVFACDCTASAQTHLDADCFLWCPLDFDDEGARDDE